MGSSGSHRDIDHITQQSSDWSLQLLGQHHLSNRANDVVNCP